ncbi:MAG: acetyl-CoA C-acyltransferase [Spirochaetae bacterium HGW-Spirochaetae-9]|nr:MAG: acetyl-CoA C-acyltransferase [Spirochaetae bacterium HGW-Spirochaetae-9]
MENVVIVSAVRTPIGRMGGVFAGIPPEELSRLVIEEALGRAGTEKGAVDEVVWGQAKQSADASNMARVALLKAGLPEAVPGYTVQRQCASSLQAIFSAAMQIQTGNAGIIVAGGVESMSQAPFYMRNARYGYEAGNGELLDPNTESQPRSQPEEVYGRLTMGLTAENLAAKYEISRESQDRFSVQSQTRAIEAMDSGRFAGEIAAVTLTERDGVRKIDTDEHPRRGTTMEKLAKLKPAFKENGTVTAGNSSGRNDGAAALVMMSESRATSLGLEPIARYVATGISGVDPRIMGIGPVPAVKLALAKSGMKLGDIGLIEINEAFAVQSLACIGELGLDEGIVNVNGGAIALGHPLGATGARISVTLLYEMIKRKTRFGLATLCVGGGQGMAMIFENLAG